MNAVELIKKKRDGEILTADEIAYLIKGYTANEIPDYQIAAFLMAYYYQDMVLANSNYEELAHLTREISRSGDILDFSRDFELIYDKHSTGGVGDKLTFICAPIIAACDCPALLLSGRGLGHTGGTLDKMESIPGMNVFLEKDEILNNLKEVGLVICGQTAGIAPADKKLYALRDVTGSVESVGLISASILGKKLAVTPACLTLDVKCGRGAFMKKREDSRRLAETMMGILKAAGRSASALITDMDQPLGLMVGNSLEIKESIRALQRPDTPEFQDIIEVSVALAAESILMANKAPDLEKAKELAWKKLRDGSAFEKFKQFVAAQGGEPEYIENPEKLSGANETVPVLSDKGGFITGINSYLVGLASNLLGAGRFKTDDKIDHASGIEFHKKVGDEVRPGDPVCLLHFNSRANLEQAQKYVTEAIEIGPEQQIKIGLIIERLK